MNEIKELLEKEIVACIKDLSLLTVGSKEKSSAVEDLATLYKLRIEETKIELETSEKIEARKSDDRIRMFQLDKEVIDRYLRLGIDVANVVAPMMFYAVWMDRGFKFEETGTFTSNTFRGLFSRFKPTNV